jgi:uridine phosphorylase
VVLPHAARVTKEAPEACVITFFREVIERKRQAGELEQIGASRSETVDLPVYVTEQGGAPVGLVAGYLGAPGSAALLEELITSGFRKFIVCGGAGVLRREIQAVHLVVPYAALRDEGVSYHYAPPSREIACSPEAVAAIERVLHRENIPFLKAKTWTTDAIFRETRDKIAKCAAEGCVTVEMETAALFAVAQFQKVTLGQIPYGGDDVSGLVWDRRLDVPRDAVRAGLVDLCLKIAAEM